MPDTAADELHGRRAQRVILGEFQLGGKNTAFEWGTLGALDQGFPVVHVIFRDRARRDAIGGVGREVLVLVEETLLGDGGHGGQSW